MNNLAPCGKQDDLCTKSAATGNLAIFQMVFKKEGAQYGGDAHTRHHLTLVATGRVGVISNGRETVVQRGDMIWIPRAIPHLLRALPDPDAKTKEQLDGMTPDQLKELVMALQDELAMPVVYCIQALSKKDHPGEVLDDLVIPGGTPDWAKVEPLLMKDAIKEGIIT